MNNDDKRAFGVLMAACAEVYEKKLTTPLLSVYFESLKDLRLDQIESAIKEAAKTAEFMPRPALLRKLAVGSDEDDAILAWADVIGAQRIGPYKAISFQNRTINIAIHALGGWPTLLSRCSTHREEGNCRAEFLRLYSIIKRRTNSTESMRPLPGLHSTSTVLVACNSQQTLSTSEDDNDEERPTITFRKP